AEIQREPALTRPSGSRERRELHVDLDLAGREELLRVPAPAALVRMREHRPHRIVAAERLPDAAQMFELPGFGIRDSGFGRTTDGRTGATASGTRLPLQTIPHSRFPIPCSSRLYQLDAIQALAQRMRVATLRELDLQAHFVGRVGVAQRVLVTDLAGLVQLEQALVEGLHAEVGRLLHHVLELVDLALTDVVL